MKKFLKDETAEFAIDAIFGITFFMITLIAIMFMALIIRVQSNIQYALGQTAKEISGYYYLVDKIGVAAISAGNTDSETDVDNVLKNVMDFSENTSDTISSFQSFSVGADFNDIRKQAKNVEANIKTSADSFKKVESSIRSLDANSVSQVLSVFAKTGVNRVVSNLIAPIICEKMMYKYLSSDEHGNISDYYTAIGIKSPDFTGSQFLSDKRSIKIQITYDLDVSKYTLGFVTTPIRFRQAASTAAWVRPDGTNLAALDMKDMGYKGE